MAANVLTRKTREDGVFRHSLPVQGETETNVLDKEENRKSELAQIWLRPKKVFTKNIFSKEEDQDRFTFTVIQEERKNLLNSLDFLFKDESKGANLSRV